jgi:hypothetical protein
MSPAAAVLLPGAVLLLASCGAEAPPTRVPASPPPAVLPAQAPPALPAFDPLSATATILVRATMKGPVPRMRPINFDADAKCGSIQRAIPAVREDVVCRDGRLANAIAWISRGSDRWTFPPPPHESLLEMRDCIFVPHVLTIRVGQPLRVSNPDHPNLHFHSVSTLNGEVTREIPEKGSHVMKFTEEEVGIRFKCDVHGWMAAKAAVFAHPFHGVTDHEGLMMMKVPPGEYEVTTWHEWEKWAARPAPQPVTVAAGEMREMEFIFEAR